MQVSGKMDGLSAGVRQDGWVSAGVRQDGQVNAGVRQDASQNIQNSHQRCKSHCLGQVTFIRNETPSGYQTVYKSFPMLVNFIL